MKFKAAICIILVLCLFSGCSFTFPTLENADNLEFQYKYAKTDIFGGQHEINKKYTVTQAIDFTKKFLSVLYNRNYPTISGDEENVLYSDYYIEKNKNLDKYFTSLREFYCMYMVTTELSSIEINNVIMIGGNAYVNATATVMLKGCISDYVAKQIGFSGGIGSTNKCKFNLKLEYKKKEYKVYAIERVKEEGSLLAFADYAPNVAMSDGTDNTEIVDNTDTFADAFTKGNSESGTIENTPSEVNDQENITRVKNFIETLASRQHNRNYQTLEGNEDYPLFSEEYIASLNKNHDDVAYTKDVYQKLQLSTELVSTDIKKIDVKKDAYIVYVDITSKITGCVSNEKAKEIGYAEGIGGNGVMSFIYTVKNMNGELKLVASKQTK